MHLGGPDDLHPTIGMTRHLILPDLSSDTLDTLRLDRKEFATWVSSSG